MRSRLETWPYTPSSECWEPLRVRGQGILGTSRKIALFHKEEGGDQERERDMLKVSGL